MSTRSYIAKQVGPDQYRTIFCHFDGYLDHVGAMLAGHYDTEEMVDKLLDVGDVDALYPQLYPDPDQPHDHWNKQQDVTVAYGRDYGELESEATVKTMDELEQESGYIEFTYIFAEDKRWKFFHAGQSCEGLKDLKDTLDQMGIDYLPEAQTEEVAFEQTM